MRVEPYSYRSDVSVPDFDDSTPLIIFDGHCVLCSTGVQWLLTRDPKGDSRFAAVQTPVPRAIYNHYGLNAETFDTFMVLWNGTPYLKWEGAMAAARTMPQPWRALGHLGRVVPSFIGDRLYDWVQRNRIAWFGARETCFVPGTSERHRFLLDPLIQSPSAP